MSDEELISTELFLHATEPVIFQSIREGLLDLDKSNDPLYIITFLKSQMEEIPELLGNQKDFLIFTYDDVILNTAEKISEEGDNLSTIILVITVIEQKINYFYRRFFEINRSKFKLNNTAIKNKIRNKNFHEKIGLYLKKVTQGSELPSELVKDIKDLRELRNSFVHEKFNPIGIKNLTKTSFDKAMELDIEDVLKIPERLEEELENILKDKNADYKSTKIIINTLKIFLDNQK